MEKAARDTASPAINEKGTLRWVLRKGLGRCRPPQRKR